MKTGLIICGLLGIVFSCIAGNWSAAIWALAATLTAMGWHDD